MIPARGNLVFSKAGNPIVLMLAIAIRLAWLSVTECLARVGDSQQSVDRQVRSRCRFSCNFPRFLIAGRACVFITSEPYALGFFVSLSITRVGAHIFHVVRTIETDFMHTNNALASPIRVYRFTDFRRSLLIYRMSHLQQHQAPQGETHGQAGARTPNTVPASATSSVAPHLLGDF
jgi:hypothetical protein